MKPDPKNWVKYQTYFFETVKILFKERLSIWKCNFLNEGQLQEMNIDDYDKINAKTVGKTQKVYSFPVSPKMITTENG